MRLSQRINNIAIQKKVGGSFAASNAIVARALIDTKNNVQIDPDDLPTTAANLLGGAVAAGIKSSSASVGVGYATGAGGAVTQATNSSTGVTINKVAGQITTVALTTAAGAEEVFTVTNSAVAATDLPVVSTAYSGAGTVAVSTKKVAAGAFDIVISNLHASSALNAAVVINYAVIKSVAA